MDATPGFFNRVAATYGEAWTIEEETRLHVAAVVDGLARSNEPAISGSRPFRALEVGCGNGRVLANLRPGVIGLDYASVMLQEARVRVPAARLVQASALALPFRPGVFDVVIAANVVHNHAEPLPVLKELGRVADRLVIDFRNRSNPIVAWRAWRWRAARFIRYTARFPQSWRRELESAGWSPLLRDPVPRPSVDPGTGFRWFHLLGALLSHLPGLAPVEVWLCGRRSR